MLRRNAADGIHLVEHAGVNCYLVEEGRRLMLVDAGLPAGWKHIVSALRELGRRPGELECVVLTHGHFDHIGTVARIQRDFGLPVFIHPDDAYIAAHPYRYQHENSRLVYPFRYPGCLPVLAKMSLAGALNVRGVRGLEPLSDETAATLPGQPLVVGTPGHTAGHCALHFPHRDAVISGDALVTLDPYTGQTGPQTVSAAATGDSRQAVASLDALESTATRLVLPGHGLPFTDGVAEATRLARKRGTT
ncbi:MBL fold metallo-hydrolase [Micrococcaceae bacterium RIT802]|nr:MBL fold metallo-hydrolase [Micrococcaceae bacterium RIT 802]